jgi:hypothetical protein
MNFVNRILVKLFRLSVKESRQRWEEEYLSQATDLADLERRQRRLERGEVANPYLARFR